MLMTDIHVRSFSGSGIRPYVHSIAKLRCEILKDYPYFEDLNPHTEADILRKLSLSPEAIGVLIFENTTLVGVSFGYPLVLEEIELHTPFKEKGWDIDSCYFFGESTLLKPYRGRGIGHHFFDARELFVSQFPSFKRICFCAPTSIDSIEERPSDFVPMHDFWRKRGYIHHPEMQVTAHKKRAGDYPNEIPLSFWIKNLTL